MPPPRVLDATSFAPRAAARRFQDAFGHDLQMLGGLRYETGTVQTVTLVAALGLAW